MGSEAGFRHVAISLPRYSGTKLQTVGRRLRFRYYGQYSVASLVNLIVQRWGSDEGKRSPSELAVWAKGCQEVRSHRSDMQTLISSLNSKLKPPSCGETGKQTRLAKYG